MLQQNLRLRRERNSLEGGAAAHFGARHLPRIAGCAVCLTTCILGALPRVGKSLQPFHPLAMWSSVCWFARRGTTVSASRLRSGGRILGSSLGQSYSSSSGGRPLRTRSPTLCSAHPVYWFPHRGQRPLCRAHLGGGQNGGSSLRHGRAGASGGAITCIAGQRSSVAGAWPNPSFKPSPNSAARRPASAGPAAHFALAVQHAALPGPA